MFRMGFVERGKEGTFFPGDELRRTQVSNPPERLGVAPISFYMIEMALDSSHTKTPHPS